MRLHDPRIGDEVVVRTRPVAFSFFPTIQGSRREAMQSIVFSSDPWNIISHEINKISHDKQRDQALAFLAQARDFFNASSESDISAAKPLLLYYSFLNLAKCYISKKTGRVLGRVHHGLSENLPTTQGAIHGEVRVYVDPQPRDKVFQLFAEALNSPINNNNGSNNFLIRSEDFLSQILIGHRVFCNGEGLKEKFVSIEDIKYVHDPITKEIWLRVRYFADDFKRLSYPLTSLSKSLSGGVDWRNVNCDRQQSGRRLIEAETMNVWGYTQRPSQAIGEISKAVRGLVWRSVISIPPYRKYYVYRPTQAQFLMNQLLSIYLATFYLGSITRYKPEEFDKILKSDIGPFVMEFFANQPAQFLYLMASEFAEQEVARAAII
ncbi:YaaC family protein [Erythrobacter sp. sf7]|uniref:YaaC family protein n=1 Tax=Erythrobacter fulvus TaxID=2987523 RepID=A0ABT5JQ89_9SPHN|nr:YaaC family protein [Erythrobacter fulvus]MDC8754686.1 YaaC family protein [Erythrobacter fulvus]